MRILLTGGAGYVGSACLRHLLAHGHDPIAYDNLSEGHRASVPDGRLVVGELDDVAALTAALRDHRADAVMHFAASAYVGESVENPDKYYGNNVAGSLHMLRAMRAAGVERLLFSSTCSTYGNAGGEPITEATPQGPVNPYARTKMAVEWMIRDFADAYGIGFTLLRYFNASGADPDGAFGEDHQPESHLIPLILQVALGQREKIMIFGDDYDTPDGTCVRDYIHTSDLASAHRLALEATTTESRAVFNIGTGNGASVRQVLRACEQATGQTIRAETVGRRAGDPAVLVADPTKLKSELGWEPEFPTIDDVVATAWRWHQAHPNGYADKAVQA